MHIRRPTAALFLSACFVLFPFRAGADVLDHVAAAVNDEVITASELTLAVALNVRLGGERADQKALESETLDGLITRRLLIQESRRLKLVEVSAQDLAAAMNAIAKRFGSDQALDEFLDRLDGSRKELSGMLEEQLLVERFVEKKVGLFVRVSRDEAQAYFDSHAAAYQGRRFQDVQKGITAMLTEQKIGQQLDQYLAELRGKADIRINPS